MLGLPRLDNGISGGTTGLGAIEFLCGLLCCSIRGPTRSQLCANFKIDPRGNEVTALVEDRGRRFGMCCMYRGSVVSRLVRLQYFNEKG
jgi:hypothetical protein